MARWTPNGWETCLGAALKHSNWDGQCGDDFECEAKARNVCAEEAYEYLQRVMRLGCVAALKDENPNFVRGSCLVDPKSPWWSLHLLQRKRLAQQCQCYKQKHPPCGRPNLLSDMHTRSLQQAPNNNNNAGEVVQVIAGGAISIPAASWQGNRKGSKIVDMISFLGGRQIFIPGDLAVEYELPTSVLPPQMRSYQLQIYLNTVHRNEEPALVTMQSTDYTIPIPYTMGLWEWTAPVTVPLPGSHMVPNLKLVFKRQCKRFGMSVKEIRMTPV
jgi:hypothetical protein